MASLYSAGISPSLEDFWIYSEELKRDGVSGWISLSYYEEIHAKVQNNALPYTSLYFLNPRASWTDVQFIVLAIAALISIRLLFSGASRLRSTKRLSFVDYFALKTGLIKKGKLHKFAEAFWYVCWHSTAFCWGAWLLYGEAGTSTSPGWMREHPFEPDGRWFWFATDGERSMGLLGWPLLVPTDGMRYFYLTQASFWISSALYLTVEVRRSDDFALIIHHFATIFLVLFSYICSYWRLGLVVLVLHDVVDVFLYASKALHYTVLPPLLNECVFAGLVVSFIAARLLLFPLWCLRAVVDLRYMSALLPHRQVYSSFFPGGVLLPFLLSVLQALHLFWFTLIIRMTARVIQAKNNGGSVANLEDLRSEPDTDVSPHTKEE